MRKYDDYTVEHKPLSGSSQWQWIVYGWGVYPRHSVLAGQASKTFLESYDTEAEALAAYPQAAVGYRDAGNTFNHLPGEDDPVPGGMYPDDWTDEPATGDPYWEA